MCTPQDTEEFGRITEGIVTKINGRAVLENGRVRKNLDFLPMKVLRQERGGC
jgi:hypothetical protein